MASKEQSLDETADHVSCSVCVSAVPFVGADQTVNNVS